MSHDELRMTLVEHLGELRDRLVRVAIAVTVGFFATYAFHQELFDWLSEPIRTALAERGIYRLQAIEVAEAVFVYMKMALIAGVVVTSPYSFYQIWAFVAPGLLPEEKRYIVPISAFSTLFFLMGTAFAYWVLLPFVTGFLTDLTLEGGHVELQVTMSSVYSFTFLALAVFGLIFQLPILMFFLSLFGIADYRKFVRLFRYFVVAAFVIGAILTPPDPISQTMMAVPMVALYGLGIVMSFFVGKREVDKNGQRTPISARLWWLVSGFILLLAGAIGLLTQWLRPGAEPLHLLPGETRWAVGVHMEQLGDPTLATTMNSLWTATPELAEALTDMMTTNTTRTFVWFGASDGSIALLAKLSTDEVVKLTELIEPNRENNNSSDHPLVVMQIADEVVGLGTETGLRAAIQCHTNTSACLDNDTTMKRALADVPFRAPAWAIVPNPGADWLTWFPAGTEMEHVDYLAAELHPGEPFALVLEAGTSGEAAAKAYRTRIQGWKEQRRLERSRDQQLAQRSSETAELVRLVDMLAETLQREVSRQAKQESLSDTARSEIADTEQKIADIRAKITAVGQPQSAKTANSASHPTLFDTAAAAAINDWEVGTDSEKLRLRIGISASAAPELLTLAQKMASSFPVSLTN